MKKLIVFGSFLIFTLPNLHAQKIIGNWKGSISVNGIDLPIVFHFNKSSSGEISGNWDSPKQNANGLPYSSVEATDDSLHVEIKMINGSYEGKFVGEDSITGMWTQQGHSLPLNFARTNVNEQTQNEPVTLPGEKEISITSAGGSKLYGTLLSKNNQQPVAIIIAGSGPTDRNGNSTMGPATNEYRMLAQSLDSQNIATFRYDKRGIAKSAYGGMQESDLVFDDYVKDAEKIFDYLHDTLGFKNIYFIGHSEGSLIGILASEKRKVKGYISVAGAGRPIDEVLEEQMQKQPLPDSVKQQIPQIFSQLKNGQQVNNVPPQLNALFRKSIQPYLISWLKYSPQKEIKKLNCPILILQGSCDFQVKELDAKNLHEANTKSKLDIIPNMSHTLKNAGPNCANENQTYTDGTMPLDNRLVEDIAKFIKARK
ncbi:MAG TPA: alpha/beta fold hydrolase [Hanamia sp.]|nr:alpha/beta fold hydrolase [Hanamia sp.]